MGSGCQPMNYHRSAIHSQGKEPDKETDFAISAIIKYLKGFNFSKKTEFFVHVVANTIRKIKDLLS